MTSTRVGGTSALRITSTITTVTCKRIIRHNHRQWRNLLTGCVTDDGCRSEEHTSELQSQSNLVCRLLLEKKKKYTMLEQRFRSRNRSYPSLLHYFMCYHFLSLPPRCRHGTLSISPR